MSINRVSFGQIIDIHYRYDNADVTGAKKADIQAEKDNKILNANHSYHDADILKFHKPERFDGYKYTIAPKMNRVIVGDSLIAYKLLRKINSELAYKYAEKNAQKFVVDV